MKVIRRAVQAGLVMGMIGTAAFAQNLGDAKKAIDAEKYQQAKTILKKLIATQPASGENYFYLGNAYLKTEYVDSAKATFTKGVSASNEYPLNYVGLGAVDLHANNAASAKTNFDKALSLAKKKDYTPYLYIGKAYTNNPKPNYAAAIENLEKAKSINEKDAEIFLALGDAYNGDKKNSEAYSAYRTAFDMDKNLLRAKIELGKTLIRSKAYNEATNEFNAVLATNPDYAPAYRELAEAYYLWAKDNNYEVAKIKEALKYYGKYMDLTDRSIESRMRYADFLILAREYSALEQEAQEMAKIDKANPRIYRYLGYSAFENGHFAESVTALKEFMAKSEKVIGQDYYYLGRAQLQLGDTSAVSTLAKAIATDSSYAEPLSELAKTQFTEKKYGLAARLYELAITYPQSKTLVYDNFYLGMAHYFDYAGKDAATQKASRDILVKADSAFSFVIQKSPTTPDSYLYRARVNRLLDDDQNSKGLMVPFYEKFIEIVSAKPEAVADSRNKRNLAEAYNNLGAFYIRSNQSKAKDYFNKTIQLDPTNTYAPEALKSLGN
ncbi:tetratricopeptide repeat protein [Arcticibacter tournemirensis]